MLVGDSLSVREPMTGKSLDFEIAPGYEGSIERYLGRDASNHDWFLEVGCWGFNNWVSTADALSNGQVTTNSPLGPVTHGSLVSPFQGQIFGPQGPIFGLEGADVINARYNSSFNSAEINLWVRPRSSPDRLVLHPDGSWHRECQPGLYTSFLFGFRYFNVDEQLHLHGSGTYAFDALPVPNTEAITGDYYLNTRNNMYGFQLGAELMERDCRWEYGFRFKVAPMMNVVEGSSQLSTSSLGNVVLPPWVTTTQIAADIDLGAVATYKIHPNVAIKAGYDIAWLTGVGLAPEQIRSGSNIASLLSTGSSQTPNTHGTIFYQGLTLGLTWMR
jgi:hypothetical protein